MIGRENMVADADLSAHVHWRQTRTQNWQGLVSIPQVRGQGRNVASIDKSDQEGTLVKCRYWWVHCNMQETLPVFAYARPDHIHIPDLRLPMTWSFQKHQTLTLLIANILNASSDLK